MSKNVKIKVTSAFVYGGQIRTPGKIVEMPEAEAKPILEREKAVMANGGDDAKGRKPAKGADAGKGGNDAGANGGKDATAGANAKKD